MNRLQKGYNMIHSAMLYYLKIFTSYKLYGLTFQDPFTDEK